MVMNENNGMSMQKGEYTGNGAMTAYGWLYDADVRGGVKATQVGWRRCDRVRLEHEDNGRVRGIK